MVNGWILERRARQAELIRGWQPWKQSTGLKSVEGNERVTTNAWRGGHWLKLRQAVKALKQAMQEQWDKLS